MSRLKRELKEVEDKLGRLARQAETGAISPEETARQLKRLRSDVEDVQRLVRRIASSL